MSPPADHQGPSSPRIGLAQFLLVLLIFAVGADAVYRWTNGNWPFTQAATTDDAVFDPYRSLAAKNEVPQSPQADAEHVKESIYVRTGTKQIYDRIPGGKSVAPGLRESAPEQLSQLRPETPSTRKKEILDRIPQTP